MSEASTRKLHRRRFLGLTAGACVGVGYANRIARSQSASALESIAKAAKEEGTVVLYTGATENIVRRIADAFGNKYGVKVQFLRLGGAPLVQRYSAEAEAGNFACDVVFVAGGGNQFAASAGPRGWIEPVSELPVVTIGEFPGSFMRKFSALIQIAPWVITYNQEKLKGEDVPKDWADLLTPKFRNQILTPDPASTDAVVQFWAALYDKYGESYLAGIRAQDPRWFSDAFPALQALAAGEGLIQVPITTAAVSAITSKGAQIGIVMPDYTTGVEMQVMVTARDKAKHPNAARLLANYVMSREGNEIFNSDPGSIGIYDSGHLPKAYVAPAADVTDRREPLRHMLGRS